MEISAILIQVHPTSGEPSLEEVQGIPGLSIEASEPKRGRLLATLESADTNEAQSRFMQLGRLPGVLGVSLLFHVLDA